MIKHVNSEKEFDTLVSKGKYLIDFYAEWCGPCKMLIPILEELEEKMNIIKVNTDEVSELAIRYGVMSIPTLILIEDGILKKQEIGYKTKEELIEFYEN